MKKNNLLRMLSALLCMAMLLGGLPVYSEDAIENVVVEEVITPQPTAEPTEAVTEAPTQAVTESPTEAPTEAVAETPTEAPAVSVAPESTETAEEKAVVDAWILQLKASSPADDYDAVLRLYNALMNHAEPDDSASAPDTAEAVLVYGSGNSLAYARAFKLLLDAYDIENLIVYNDTDRNVAWNIVKIDDVWVHIDAFADDKARTPEKHFALFDEDMAADHSWDRSSVPACVDPIDEAVAMAADLTEDTLVPTEIVPAAKSVTLGVGQTISVADWKFSPDGTASEEEVSYTSSKAKVAKVDANGTVKAVAKGSAVITIKVGDTLRCTVAVKVLAAPSSIKLSISRTTLGVDESADISISATKGSCTTYTCKSSNTAVVAVEGDRVTAVGEGTATVTAESHNGKKSSVKITVLEKPESLELAANEITLGVGESYTLGYSLNKGSAGAVKFETDSDNIVSVDEQSGKITALSTGNCRVTVTTYNDVSETCAVNVVPAPAKVTLSTPDDRTTYGVGETLQLNWSVDERGSAPVTFTSSNKKLATVSASGLVTFKKAGKVTITAKTYNGKSAKISLTCKKAPTSIKLTAKRDTLGVGESIELSATLSSGSAGSYSFVVVEGDDVVSVDGHTLTANSVGTAKIRAVSFNNKKSATYTVTVLEKPEDIFLNKDEVSIGVGDSYTLTATLNDGSAGAYGFTAENSKVSVDKQSGKITALSTGDCRITVTTYNEESTTCLVHVVAAPKNITLSTPGDRVSFGVGETAQLSWVTDNGCDGTMKFYTSKSSVATVSADGVITAKRTGSATITVKTYNGRTDSVKITVVKAPTSLKLTTDRTTLGVGEKLTLVTKLSSGSVGYVGYVSDNPDVLSVNENGEVSALTVGKATVTATSYNKLSKSVDFEVKNAPTEIVISDESDPLELRVEDTVAITAAPGKDSAGALYYSSADEDIATVDENGNVSGISAGKTRITVSTYVEGVQSIVDVIVKPIPTYVQLPWTQVSIGVGDTLQLVPEVDPAVDIATTSFTYTLSKSGYVTVDANGLIRAKKVGTITVTVTTHNGKTCNLKVIVKKAPSSVSFNPDTVTLGIGETVTPQTTLTSNSASTLTYESTDTAIATVDENGLITALKKGTTTVTVTTHNGKSDSCAVTVVDAPTKISLMGTQLLGVGMTSQLTCTLSPTDSSSAIRYEVIKGEDIISVSDTGLVTALAEGEATVRARTYLDKVYADLDIIVKPAPTKISFGDVTEYSINVDQTDFYLLPTTEPEDSVASYTYKIKKAGFFTIDENGLVTPIMRGSTTVTVTSHNGLRATVTIKILDPYYPESFEFADDMTSVSIKIGATYTPQVTVYPKTALPRIQWSSSDDSIATVDALTGTVTGVSSGKVTITGKSQANPALKKSYNVTVLSDKRCLTMPTMRVTSTSKISSVFTQIKNVRESAYSELTALNADGDISDSELSTRKDIVTRAFDMLLFAWTPDATEYYWKSANSINGLKNFKAGTIYFGLPYTQTQRKNNKATVLATGYFTDNGSYYTMKTKKFDQRSYPGNDCSSFVSQSIWGRKHDASFYTTGTIYSSSYYKTFTDTKELKPGDILVKDGHVIMFLYYANAKKTQMVIIEQGGGGETASTYSNTIACRIKNISDYVGSGKKYIMRKKKGLT